MTRGEVLHQMQAMGDKPVTGKVLVVIPEETVHSLDKLCRIKRMFPRAEIRVVVPVLVGTEVEYALIDELNTW